MNVVKKVLSPLLSALLLAGCAAGTDVPTVHPTAAPETPDTAQSSETAETAGAAAVPQGLIPTDAPVLDYDDIRLIAYVREFQTYPDTDYYTMCRDGKWGLMRSDGTEVLPCRAPYPLFECGWNAHHWHGYTDGMTWEEIEPLQEQLNAQLKETGDGVLCDAHDGGGYRMFVYLQDASVYVYAGSIGPGEFAAPTDEALCLYSGRADGIVPTVSGTTTHESDDWYNFVSDGVYVYRDKNGTAADSCTYSAADFFFDAPLAPAQRDGRWVYLDTMGREATGLCYDAVYDFDIYSDTPLTAARAAPLLNGYAVVCRDGQFGLLDGSGAEFVPCTYDGLVWDGGTAWVKQNDGWHEYTIPGVAKPDPLDTLSGDIVAPDTRPTRTDTVYFRADADSSNRLNLRTGPGTEYDIIDRISSSTLRVYGYASAAPGWALVRYDPLYGMPHFGWVSTSYLLPAE